MVLAVGKIELESALLDADSGLVERVGLEGVISLPHLRVPETVASSR